MKNSSRAIAVVKLLMDTPAGEYTAFADIAERLGVSTKTISREIPNIESYLKEFGVNLLRKPGSGLGLMGSRESLQKLYESIWENGTQKDYTPEERRAVIISQLLPNREPVKLYALSSMLKVTNGTISNDLDKLEDWFSKQKLELVRRPGLGVYVEGSEKDLRQAMVRFIYDNVDEQKLLRMVDEGLTRSDSSGSEGGAFQYLMQLMDKQVIKRLEDLVKNTESEMDRSLSDQAFIGLVVHLSLAVQRIRKKEEIKVEPTLLEDLKTKQEFQVASLLAAKIAEEFDLVIPEDEIAYITMHLLGARNSYRKDNVSVSVMDKFHLVRLAKSIIGVAEQETGKKLYRNMSLLVGLVNHLGPAISRLKLNMEIRNPLLDEMKENYPELMAIARRSVGRLESLVGHELPESEVAYIAMHIGAAMIESDVNNRRNIRVVVACPTGIGTSRLLASRLKKQYKSIDVVDIASTVKLTPEYIAKHRADILISTVPVRDAGIPALVVNPLLTQQDLELIEGQLVRQSNFAVFEKEKQEDWIDFKAAMEQLGQYNQAILQLLNNFFLNEVQTEPDISVICGLAAGMAAEAGSETDIGSIQKALLAREEAGTTMVHGANLLLLHCNSEFVRELHFGIIHLKQDFNYPGGDSEPLRTIIVMVAPADADNCFRETIGYISSVLLDRSGLIGVLHEGDRELIYEELTKIFKEFFKEKYETLVEGGN